MRIYYRPGKENVQADALSRQDQDAPQDNSDERVTTRDFIMLTLVERQEPV
jgi:hypothetical protein